jgi:uncharacterized damage-inducible protein DinB
VKHLLLSLSFFTTTLTAQKSDMELVKNYLAYTLWANEQMTHWMSEASDEIWTKEIESSFTSIESTTKHLWLITMGRQAGLANPPRTDYIYFIRLNQEEKQRLWERITTE